MYPLMINAHPPRLVITFKDFLLIAQYSLNPTEDGGGEIVFGSAQRVKLLEAPTAVSVGQYSMVVGYKSGRIMQYCFRSQDWEGASD